MVDKTLLLRKLAELEELLAQVKEYENVAVAEYETDWKIQRIIERTLQMMIETCADTAEHIISDKGYRVPTSYADTFAVLHENRILNSDLFAIMEKMARFRNIIVHRYDRVDAEIIVGIVRKNLNDFLRYKEAIVTMLKTDEAP
jgi:uncharacterized protein YutE (UPF0331/DUF86 family)